MADVHVRPARPDDAAEIARIQLSTWRTAYSEAVPTSVLDGVGDELATAQWAAAISSPPSREHRVLVAQENQYRVGFAAFGPAEDDGTETGPGKAVEITTLLVEPRWGRRGHGSRLLAAVADLAGTAGYSTAVTWILVADSASLSFYRGAGWEPDGSGRAMDMDGTTVHEIRLHASLLPEGDEDQAP